MKKLSMVFSFILVMLSCQNTQPIEINWEKNTFEQTLESSANKLVLAYFYTEW